MQAKIVLHKKTDFSGTWLVFNWHNRFSTVTFLEALFTKIQFTFLNQYEERFFDTPLAIFEVGKMQETGQYFEKRFFYKQVIDFRGPSKLYATHRNCKILSKLMVPTALSLLHFLDAMNPLPKTSFIYYNEFHSNTMVNSSRSCMARKCMNVCISSL